MHHSQLMYRLFSTQIKHLWNRQLPQLVGGCPYAGNGVSLGAAGCEVHQVPGQTLLQYGSRQHIISHMSSRMLIDLMEPGVHRPPGQRSSYHTSELPNSWWSRQMSWDWGLLLEDVRAGAKEQGHPDPSVGARMCMERADPNMMKHGSPYTF